jgi:AraC-like DNA-binding protein
MNTLASTGGSRPAVVHATPSFLAGNLPAPRTVFTTATLPPHRQFDAWRHEAVPFVDIDAPALGAASGFAATATGLRFGPFLLYASRAPACGQSRRPLRIRRDSLDHWLIAICRRGMQRQRSGDTVMEFRQRIPYVLNMARAFESKRIGAEIEWITLRLARDAVPELEAALSAALFAPLDNVSGLLLAEFLCGLSDGLEGVQLADLPHLATATRALLAAALQPVGGGGDTQVELLAMARVRRLIRDNLGAATLTPGRLAAMAGMSRSQLYRLFEPMGGVARFIQRERLRRVQRLLSDPRERRDIAALAEEVGFFDPSSFSRAFRREFGCTPREGRAEALAVGAMTPATPRETTVMALLRDL